MEEQVESAIELAFNPTTDQALKSQAYTFLDELRRGDNGWRACLNLFTRTPAPSEVVRLVCLELVNNAVQYQRLEASNLKFIHENLMGYVRQWYTQDAAQPDSPPIQNKLTQTVTYLFTALYAVEWPDFFQDFESLAGDTSSIGIANHAAAMMYLRIIGSIHDEIADVMIPRTGDEQKRCNDLKDLIRVRDVSNIARVWQAILSRWQHVELGVVELCLRTIAKWVSWIDISVVIDRTIQGALLELAGQQGQFAPESKEAKTRDAAIDTFTETVAKKMGASDKIELIRYLNVIGIVGRLVESPALSELRATSYYDTDLSETVAKLVNIVVYDIVKVLDTAGVDQETTSRARELLRAFVPYLLRFFGDEYDEICSAVIPSLTDLLTMCRKQVKSNGGLPADQSDMLRPILDTIVAKMKYDETASWGEEDEATDEAEFQELRKKLYVLQQTVAAVDERLYIDVLSTVIASTLSNLDSADVKPNWRDLDLALHEMYLFGELAVKNGGLYHKSQPSSEASQRLLEMMTKLVGSGLSAYPHPAIQIQFLEICVRYVQYFEHHPSAIPQILESFVAFVHSQHPKVRLRSWYLFHRFVRHLRAQLGNVAHTVAQAVGDLLNIKAELPEDKDEDDVSSEDNGHSADATFTSQLYLFEAIGCVASTNAVPTETKVAIAKSVIDPLCSDIQQHLPTAETGDPRSMLQASHVVMALGTLANGFSDWSPGSTSGGPPPNEISAEFVVASEATLAALETLKEYSEIRTAARHAFSRLLGVLGSNVFPQLPRWIDGLLSSASSNDEMAMFLRTLAQVVYGFKSEIFDILDRLLTPLLQRVFSGLGQPTSGTDDEIQLRELRREYLNFILVILNNNLGSVLISQTNQSVFDNFISTITRFSSDLSDPQSARQSFSVLNHVSQVWGGPDIDPGSETAPTPALSGFDAFMVSQFAPLPWSFLSNPAFNARDAQMRSVVQEAGALQWTMLRKIGTAYQSQLQGELANLGVREDGIREYFRAIGSDQAAFRKFYAAFAQQAKQ